METITNACFSKKQMGEKTIIHSITVEVKGGHAEEASKSSRCEARVQTPTPPERCPAAPLGFTGTLHGWERWRNYAAVVAFVWICGLGAIRFGKERDQSFTLFAGQVPTTSCPSDTTTYCCFIGGIISNASSRTTWSCYEDNERGGGNQWCVEKKSTQNVGEN